MEGRAIQLSKSGRAVGTMAVLLLAASCGLAGGADAGGAEAGSDGDIAHGDASDGDFDDGDSADGNVEDGDAMDNEGDDGGGTSDTDTGPTPPRTCRELGTLGGDQSAAFGINSAGQVVGWALTSDGPERRAFVWTDGVMADLGVLEGDEESTARAINDEGTIVGTSESNVFQGHGDYRPFVVRDGAMTELPGLGGPGGWAAAINASGTICGYSYNDLGEERAAIWTGGGVTDIASASARSRQRAFGINDLGEVVGHEYQPMFGPGEAFRYDALGWTVIGGADSPYQVAEARDINNAGVAAGFSNFPRDAWHAALWDAESTEATDLGTLPDLPTAELYAINEHGWAVGRAYNDDATRSRAILWTGTELVDLQQWLLPETCEGVLWEARDINDAGQVAATAEVDGSWRALLIQLPEASF